MCGWSLLRACLHFESQKKNPGALSIGGPNPANYQNLKPSKALLGKKKLKHGPTKTLQNKLLFPQFLAPAWLEIQLLCNQPHFGDLRLFQGHVGSMIVGTRVPLANQMVIFAPQMKMEVPVDLCRLSPFFFIRQKINRTVGDIWYQWFGSDCLESRPGAALWVPTSAHTTSWKCRSAWRCFAWHLATGHRIS